MIKRSGIRILAGLLVVLAVWGSYQAIAGWAKPASVKEAGDRHREDNPANAAAIDSALLLLRDGDLVVRTGADAISVMLRQMNLRDKTYSHCGIVMIEDGYPFVYHSIGGEDNPDERLRRDSAAFFFSPIYNERMGIARLDLTSTQIEELHVVVRRYYAARIPFDMDFDMATDDKLYCAEFVYKAIGESTKDSAYFGQSHLLDRHYVGVDNLTDERHAKIICDVRYKL